MRRRSLHGYNDVSPDHGTFKIRGLNNLIQKIFIQPAASQPEKLKCYVKNWQNGKWKPDDNDSNTFTPCGVNSISVSMSAFARNVEWNQFRKLSHAAAAAGWQNV